jgi:hypothetical protein
MSHLACPLCGKYAALSTLDPSELELELKVVSFKGLGRGKGFAKVDEQSVLKDDVYLRLIADRVEQLYYLFIDRGLLMRTIDDSILNLIMEYNKLKNQIASKDSRIYSLEKENKEKDSEIEELELRSHIDYIILESLKFPKSEKLKYDDDNYYIVITQETVALNLFLLFIMQEIPDQLKRKLLLHVNTDNYPIMKIILKNVPEKRTVADELMGDTQWRFKGLNYTGQDPYTLKLSELKKIVNRIKDTIFNPEELNKWILRNSDLGKISDQESYTDFIIRIIKELDKRSKK